MTCAGASFEEYIPDQLCHTQFQVLALDTWQHACTMTDLDSHIPSLVS